MKSDKKQGPNESALPAPAAKDAKPVTPVRNTPSVLAALSEWENEGGQTPEPAAAAKATPKAEGHQPAGAPEASPFAKPEVPNRDQQRRVEALAKESHIKQSGIDTRGLGHVSGSGKHNQARRDSKN